MNTYFKLLYETFYQMMRKIVVSDNRLESLLVIGMCVSVLIGFGIFMYYIYADKSSRSFCNEFWLVFIWLLPILGLVIFLVVEIFVQKRNQKMLKIRYRSVFWIPVACNVTSICVSGFIPELGWTEESMTYLGTQEPLFAKSMACFVLSGLVGIFVLLHQMYQSRNLRHIFRYGLETEDGEPIKDNKFQIKDGEELVEVNFGAWLCENGNRSINENKQEKQTVAIEIRPGEPIDWMYSHLKNKDLEAYYLLKFEDHEDYSYAEYASNERGDNRFIVTNVASETDDLLLSYAISLIYGVLISFPIYYSIMMNML